MKSDILAKKSVMTTRNLFGIPLLVRSESVGVLRYDSKLTYAADLDFSIAISRHAEVCHIQKPLIAYRIHGANASVSLFKSAMDQMRLIASKHDISLNKIEYLKMYLNAWLVVIQKWTYFQFLARVRK
jgi:hypothetical protein